MDGKIINLRQKRKASKREAASQQGAENRALYGRPLHERKLDKAQKQLDLQKIDGHKRTPEPPAE